MRHRLFGAYSAVCLSALIWPVYGWLGNRIEPMILGIPFSLFWVIGWIGISFVVLLAYHRSGRATRNDLPPAAREG